MAGERNTKDGVATSEIQDAYSVVFGLLAFCGPD